MTKQSPQIGEKARLLRFARNDIRQFSNYDTDSKEACHTFIEFFRQSLCNLYLYYLKNSKFNMIIIRELL
jgi:hypothetical protein